MLRARSPIRPTSQTSSDANSAAPMTRPTLPFSRYTYLSAMPASQESRCSATRIAQPLSLACPTNAVMASIEVRSRLLVGSSKSRFAGCWAQMLAKAIFWRSPPESSKMLRSASMERSSSSKVSLTRGRIFSSGHPALSSPNATSPVVSTLKNWVRGFWKSEPARCAISQVARSSTSVPSSMTLPAFSPEKKRGARPFASLSRVDLPQPDRPQSTTTSPGATDSDTFLTPASSAVGDVP